MSVARAPRVLQTATVHTANHPRRVALAAGALAVAALSLAVRSGGLAGAALLLAVVAASAAVALWSRLRDAERSHAALALTVADLTTRLDLLSVATRVVPAGQVLADAVIPNQATPEAGTADADSTGTASDPDATDVSPLRAPAESKPLQRVSEQVSRGGAGGEVGSATGALTLLPESVPPDQAATNADPRTPLVAATVGFADVVASGPLALASGPDDSTDATLASIPESMPPFTLTALNGAAITGDELAGTPAVVVFWRPGCQHCQRLTPELVAWESLQGPRLIVFAACDGPTAFRAGLPGLVILDPGFTVGQALGAPGTPAALPLDAAGRPSGPVVAGASAVTTLLLDAMRDWASVESESSARLPAPGVEPDAESASPDDSETAALVGEVVIAPPTVLLRRAETMPLGSVAVAPGWDDESDARRVG